jgi:hypothetical protein
MIRVGRLLAARTELQAERVATIVMQVAFVVAIGYSTLWWVGILITAAAPALAPIALVLMGLICVAILTPVGTVIGILDIIENFLPINKEDIPTGELVAVLATPLILSLFPFVFAWVVGVEIASEFLQIAGIVFLLCLAIGFSGTQAKKKDAKGGWLGKLIFVPVVVLFFMVVSYTIPGDTSFGHGYITAPVYDFQTLGSHGAPSHSFVKKNRRDLRTAINLDVKRMNQTITADTSPEDFYDNRKVGEISRKQVARRINGLQVMENRLAAEANGTVPPSDPDTTIEPDKVGWQSVSCLNVETQKYGPCLVSPGYTVESWGLIHSSAVKDIRTGRLVGIGPCGVTDDDPDSSPFEPHLPRFALMGRIRHLDGTYSAPFLMCNSTPMRSQGHLEAGVNVDYRDKFGRTHPEWSTEENKPQKDNTRNDGFRIRVPETK